MEDDSWAVSSSCSSRSHRSITTATNKFQSGYLDFEGDYGEEEEEEEIDVDYYPCPFCSDDYDLVELCHHIDEEHQLEATNYGICPVCSKRVKMHMVDHITTHHRDVLKSGEKQTSSYGEEEDSYYSSDKYLHSSKPVLSDQYLSFLNNSTLPNPPKLLEQQTESNIEDKSLVKDSSIEKGEKKSSLLTRLSDSEQLEKKKKKCEFVQGLLASAMFDDDDWML